jgi:hypothetical protein
VIKNCPICGKAFDVLWPELWRYVRKNRYLCSWKCIRLYDKEKKEEEQMKKDNEPIKRLRMSKDDMAEAVRLWRENDPGLEQYLKDHGINHIGKWKQNQKLRYGKSVPAATVNVDGPIRIQTKEPAQVEVLTVGTPVPPPFEYKTTGISTEAGDFQYYRKQGFLDWTTLDGTAVSMSLAEWSALMRVFPEVLKVLGVEL